jgi:hypothetical protein
MVYRPDVEEQLCFVLIPFHGHFLEYFQGILSPAAEGAGLQARKADEIYGTAPIIRDIWESIWKAKVVIADVTGRNPNLWPVAYGQNPYPLLFSYQLQATGCSLRAAGCRLHLVPLYP